jgi:hypothetical protein
MNKIIIKSPENFMMKLVFSTARGKAKVQSIATADKMEMSSGNE